MALGEIPAWGWSLQEVHRQQGWSPNRSAPSPGTWRGRERPLLGQPLLHGRRRFSQLLGHLPYPHQPRSRDRALYTQPLTRHVAPSPRPGPSNGFHVLAPPKLCAWCQQPDKIQMGLGGNSGSSSSEGSRASVGWAPAPAPPGRRVTPGWALGMPLNWGCSGSLEEGDLLHGSSWILS